MMEPSVKRFRLGEAESQPAEKEVLTSTITIANVPDGILAEIFQCFHQIERLERRR